LSFLAGHNYFESQVDDRNIDAEKRLCLNSL
jgi:hypothetical protein